MHMYMYIREYMNLQDQLACHVRAELIFSMIAFHRYVTSTIRFFQLNEWGWVDNPNGQPYPSIPHITIKASRTQLILYYKGQQREREREMNPSVCQHNIKLT